MKTLIEVIRAKIKGDGITDDKTMIMERTIQLVSKLPNGSKNQVKLTDDFIAQLWNSLDHPPLIYIGDKYMYRSADGSNNVSSVFKCDSVCCIMGVVIPFSHSHHESSSSVHIFAKIGHRTLCYPNLGQPAAHTLDLSGRVSFLWEPFQTLI